MLWGRCLGIYTSASNRTSALSVLNAIFRVKTSTPIDLVYADLGTYRQTLRTKLLVQIINYLFKYFASQDTQHIKHVYNFMLQDV